MFRWGIMGGGFISSQFAKGLEEVADMQVEVLASRSGRNDYGIQAKKYCCSYEELVNDKDVDAVYVGTIHPQHLACVKACLKAKKPVLCEKPVTMKARELEEILELAKENHTFFMEAMWTRFIPAMRELKKEIQAGVYGKVHNMHFTFGGPAKPETRRLFEAELGGGALLDVGVYGVSVAQYLLGETPDVIHAWSEKNEETVDLNTCIQMTYPCGCLADMVFSINRKVDNRAVIITDKAELEIPYFWRPNTVYLFEPNEDFRTDTLKEKRVVEVAGNGYHYEALEVEKMLKEGRTESPVMPWTESLRIMRELDEIRRICGICYPQDAK